MSICCCCPGLFGSSEYEQIPDLETAPANGTRSNVSAPAEKGNHGNGNGSNGSNGNNGNNGNSHTHTTQSSTSQSSQPSHSENIEIAPRKVPAPAAKSAFYLNYELLGEIGVGSTSKCYKCVKKSTGQEFACKVIDKRQVEMKFSGLLDQFFVEIKVLKALKHPNIIRLEESFESADRIYMVMEIMKGGELFDYVVEKGTLSEEEASVLVRKITSAVAHMHNQHIIHRDLKPENLLLTSKGANAEVKLIDFGLAKVMQETVASSFLGTKGYLAPEMLQRHSYDKAIDIWALGVIVFVLLCGCLPFDDDSSKISSESAARKKFALRFPRWAASLSSSAKDLLHNLLEINPKTRYSADQALAHPWVSGKTVLPNSYLQSPCIMGERRNELRSPALQGYIHDTHNRATGGAQDQYVAPESAYKAQRARKNSI
mmetsp:Transcript_16731/g.36517  ORF Transcript_16731/g.36517 Transcript_16731/m.36517 type:complete len:429 (-) Transcript_16731:272-1558(-)